MSEKKGFFGKLVAGLQKTRDNIISGMDSIFSGFSAIEDEFYEEIEETPVSYTHLTLPTNSLV